MAKRDRVQQTQESVKAKTVSDAELMRLVCDSIKPKPCQGERHDLEDAFKSKEAEALDWHRIARLAAEDLKAYGEEIRLAAETGQKQFFIDLLANACRVI